MRPKMAALAPIPRARVSTTTAVKPGFFENERSAKRTSWRRRSMVPPAPGMAKSVPCAFRPPARDLRPAVFGRHTGRGIRPSHNRTPWPCAGPAPAHQPRVRQGIVPPRPRGTAIGVGSTAMDIPRPHAARRRRTRQLAIAGGAIVFVLAATLGVSRLKPAAPSVSRSAIVLDTVKRGPMVRQVHGLGTLVPEEVRWIPAGTDGRVERVVVQPGTRVEADTVLLELSNPEVEQRAIESQSQLRAAEAAYNEMRVRLQSQRLDQEASAARVQAEHQQARLRADADDELAREGLVADMTRKLSRSTADELANRVGIEHKRLAIGRDAIAAQLQVQAAEVDQRRALARLRQGQLLGLQVRPGLAGVLQQISVEVGQQVTPGTNLARVAQPERLKAVIRVPETQARDLQLGQPASIDTRNGVVEGRVARVDPGAQNGTVTVNIALTGALPRGARPISPWTGPSTSTGWPTWCTWAGPRRGSRRAGSRCSASIPTASTPRGCRSSWGGPRSPRSRSWKGWPRATR